MRKLSQETKDKMKISSSRKAIYKLDMITGEILDEYESAIEARRQTGIPQSAISSCARGDSKFASGYCWELVENYNKDTWKSPLEIDPFYIVNYKSGGIVGEYTFVETVSLRFNLPARKIRTWLRNRTKKPSCGYAFVYVSEYDDWKIPPVSFGKSIHRLDKETGEILQTYNSIIEASKAFDTERWNIGIAVRDSWRTACGYKWKKVNGL